MNNTTLNSLNDSIPAAPAGLVELSDDFLADISGGNIFGDIGRGIVSGVKAVGGVIAGIGKGIGRAALPVLKVGARIGLGILKVIGPIGGHG